MMKGEVKPTLPFDPFAIAQATSEFAHGPGDEADRPDAGAARRRAAMGRILDRRVVGQGEREAARPPLCRARVAGRRLLPRASATPICSLRSSFATWSRSAKATSSSKAMVTLPARPISERHFACQFRRDQPGGGQADQGNQRRQPGPGLRPPDRGYGQRQGHRPAPDRPDRVREGQDHRRDAGRSGVRERAVPADPVHAGDRQGRGRAAALRPAAGQSLLHDRPRAPAEPGQMAGRRRPHGVRHQLGQPDRGASRTRASANMCSKASSRRSSRCGSAPAASPDLFAFCLGGTLVAIALAWLAAKKRARRGQFARR